MCFRPFRPQKTLTCIQKLYLVYSSKLVIGHRINLAKSFAVAQTEYGASNAKVMGSILRGK